MLVRPNFQSVYDRLVWLVHPFGVEDRTIERRILETLHSELPDSVHPAACNEDDKRFYKIYGDIECMLLSLAPHKLHSEAASVF